MWSRGCPACHVEERWLEERLRTAESLVADGDLFAAVGQLIALLERRRRRRGHNDERVAALVQDLHQVSTGQVEAQNGLAHARAGVDHQCSRYVVVVAHFCFACLCFYVCVFRCVCV